MKFSQTLKTWRNLHRFSQLDLAHEAGVSGRHLSFLETGRARPSREMVLKLCHALQLPLEAQNQMLTTAGFAAEYSDISMEIENMTSINMAINRLLESHLPYPGVVWDKRWRMKQCNKTAEFFCQQFGIHTGDSLIEHMTCGTFVNIIENWPEFAHIAALRLQMESIAKGGIPELDLAVSKLMNKEKMLSYTFPLITPTVIKHGKM